MPTAAVTDDTFETEVLHAPLPVVVDFWAPWCHPCKKISPILDELGEVYDTRVRVVTVNTDENPIVARRYGVTSVPTVAVFDGGEQMLTITGAKPKRVYLQKLEPWID